MSKSLIRKNQLHPDISDLVTGYGSSIFATNSQLNQQINFVTSLIPINIVYSTGDQTIDGIKNFTSRPTVNGVQVLLQGEFNGGDTANAVLITGNQNIGGLKNFTSRPTLNGIGLATTGEVGGGSTAFDGNRGVTANVIGFQGITPGGDNVITFLNNLFYPFKQATITLNNFTNNNTSELGTTVGPFSFIGSINSGSLNLGTDITNLVPFIGSQLTPSIQPTTSFTISRNVNLSNTTSDIRMQATSKDINGNSVTIESNYQTLFFVAPTYAGSGVNNLHLSPTNMRSILRAQPFLVQRKPLNSYIEINTTVNLNNFYYFVYPADWGQLTRIAGVSPAFDFIINDSFDTNTVNLTLENNNSYSYRWYKNKNSVVLSNYPIRYYFDGNPV